VSARVKRWNGGHEGRVRPSRREKGKGKGGRMGVAERGQMRESVACWEGGSRAA